MTVIRPNSVSGINSITAQANEIKIFKSDGTQGGLVIGGANLNATSGISTVAALTVTGNVSVGGTLTYQDVTNIDSVGIVTARAGVKVPDSQKIFLGTGDDLQIYHNGSHSYIVDQGVGHLYIQTNGDRVNINGGSDSLAKFNKDGNVELYYDNSKKFETTSDGVTITGTATATEGLVLDGQTGSGKGLRLDLAGSGDYIIQETTTDDVVQFGGTGSSNFFVHNISSGRIGINETAPDRILHVNSGATDTALKLESTDAEVSLELADNTGSSYIGGGGSYLNFYSGGNERLRIKSNGQIQLTPEGGSANPSGMFDTSGDNFRLSSKKDGTDGIGLIFQTQASGGSLVERLRIAADGQATFDKGAPGGANQVIARFQAESARRLDVVWHDSGSLMGFDTPSTHSYIFKCGGAEKFRITPDGRCGFNDSTGGYAETLQVTSRSSQGQYGIAVKIQNNSGYFMRFSHGSNAPCGSISSSGGNNTSFNISWSDSRRKKNFESWNEEVLPLFKTLEPKKFNFTDEDDGTEKTKGYVAQDVVNKFPEAYPLLDDTEVGEKRYMFNPSGMTVYLMKALQEEIAKREALEARIAALEG